MRGRYQDLLPSTSVGKTSLLLSKAVGGGWGETNMNTGVGAEREETARETREPRVPGAAHETRRDYGWGRLRAAAAERGLLLRWNETGRSASSPTNTSRERRGTASPDT